MKKIICVSGCVIALMLAGCQMQHVPSDTEMDTGQIAPSSSSNAGTPSASSPISTDADPAQTDGRDNPGPHPPSKEAPASPSIQPVPTTGAAILDERTGERELKHGDSLRGEIEVTHKLSVGMTELSYGETALFHIETKSADAELKITLTCTRTGAAWSDSVKGSGDISFEIDTAGEYAVMLENCSLRGVRFTIDYSIGGSK